MSQKLNFSLTQLEYVLAVHKYGHFAKAADSCFVTQPTLSMQIKKLEDDLGAALFDRSKKPILLTPIGAALIHQFQSIVFESAKVKNIIQQVRSPGVVGEIKLGVIPTLAPYLVPRMLALLEKKYPELVLDIQELQTHQIVTSLDNDEIDVGLLALPLELPKVIERPLFLEPFFVLCQKRHELAQLKKVKQNQLNLSDIWLLEDGHCFRSQALQVCGSKKRPTLKNFKFESGSIEALKNLVGIYGGYTLIPSLAQDLIPLQTQLIPFEKPIPARQVGLAFQREHYKSHLIDPLASVIVESIPESLRKIKNKDLENISFES